MSAWVQILQPFQWATLPSAFSLPGVPWPPSHPPPRSTSTEPACQRWQLTLCPGIRLDATQWHYFTSQFHHLSIRLRLFLTQNVPMNTLLIKLLTESMSSCHTSSCPEHLNFHPLTLSLLILLLFLGTCISLQTGALCVPFTFLVKWGSTKGGPSPLLDALLDFSLDLSAWKDPEIQGLSRCCDGNNTNFCLQKVVGNISVLQGAQWAGKSESRC